MHSVEAFLIVMFLASVGAGMLGALVGLGGGVLIVPILTIGFDLDIILTWKGVVLACAVMTTPLIVRTARVSFEGVDPRYEAMARTLGHGRIVTFFRYTLPLASRGLLASVILGFSRAIGEFGATIVLAGNIPGRTQTLSSAIFSAQQAGNEGEANFLLGVALAVGFTAIFLTEYLSQKQVARGARGL